MKESWACCHQMIEVGSRMLTDESMVNTSDKQLAWRIRSMELNADHGGRKQSNLFGVGRYRSCKGMVELAQ